MSSLSNRPSANHRLPPPCPPPTRRPTPSLPPFLSLVAEIAGEVGRLGALSGAVHVLKLRSETTPSKPTNIRPILTGRHTAPSAARTVGSAPPTASRSFPAAATSTTTTSDEGRSRKIPQGRYGRPARTNDQKAPQGGLTVGSNPASPTISKSLCPIRISVTYCFLR